MIHILAEHAIAGMLIGRDEFDRLGAGDGLAYEGILCVAHACCGLFRLRKSLDFDLAFQREHIAFHCGAPAPADVPSGPVIVTGVLAKDHAMDLKRAHPFLGSEDEIGDAEPIDQWNLGILENGVRGDAETVSVASATIGIAAAPSIGLPTNRSDALFPIARRAAHSVRPAARDEEIAASFFGREASIEGAQCFHNQKCRVSMCGSIAIQAPSLKGRGAEFKPTLLEPPARADASAGWRGVLALPC